MSVVTDYTALLSGSYWNGIEATGAPVIVTYSFPTSAPAYDASVGGFTASTVSSFQSFNTAQQAQVQSALGEWAAASGIVFIQVAPGQGDINFQSVDFSTTSNPSYAGYGGIGFYPFGDWNYFSYPQFSGDLDASGDVFMNSQFVSGGLFNYGTLLHEIGHAIGLKHPTEIVTDYAAYPNVAHDQVLSADDPAQTIMATIGDSGINANLKQLDKDAAAFLYGPAGTGEVVTTSNSGTNSVVSSWTWNATTQALTQTGFAGNDIIRGTSVTDVIYGLDGDNRLYGLAGDDTLVAGGGNDQLFGGSGADDMTGGGGDDTYYVDNTGDVVHESPGGGYDTIIATISFTLSAEVEQLQLYGDGLTGTGNLLDNVMFGDGAFANTLAGMDGNDYIVSGSNNDTLYGGAGNDLLYGGDGDDVIDGGAGNDLVYGGNGNDTVTYASAVTGVFVDLRSSVAQNTLGDGIDTLSGFENLAGSAFNDTLYASTVDNIVSGGDGNDYILAFAGNDTVFGGNGNDTAYGGDGNDTISGEANDDTLLGDNGDDTLYGGDGLDHLYGGAGNDLLYGGVGNDIFYGGDGNDVLDGDAGADNMRGGAGDDIYYLDNPGDIAIEAVNEGIDEVRSSNALQYLGANIENMTGLSAAGQRLAGNILDNIITALGGNDVITGDAGNDTIYGGGGNDYLYGDDGNDTLYGGDGNDSFYGGNGNDTLYGGNGNDVLDGAAGTDTFYGGGGNDLFYVRDIANHIIEAAGEGIDTAYIFANSFTLDAGSEVETIFGRLSTAMTLTGNELNNRLDGNAGNDALYGGAGNDLLQGLGGDDIIYGGDGNDTIYAGAGNDTVYGGLGKDSIDLGTGNDTLVYNHADFEAGVADNVYNFGDNTGGNLDQLLLQGIAANYQFIDGANFVRVYDNATHGSAYIYGMSAATIADQVTYFA